MKKIGVFYGSSSGTTKKVAEKIGKALGARAVLHDVKDTGPEDILKYDYLILGTSAWGIGDMQDDWEDFIDTLSELDLSGKKIALFGLGDQKKYPESFADGLGTLYCRLPEKSGVVGSWPVEGYEYYFSMSEKEGKFVGLVLDEDTQPEMTDERIKKWAGQIVKEFN
ncbi:MAG: flavodoxin [Bacteroidales bacterium]|nr:flavodoxin [Bacteroidales bacterium]